MNDMSTASSKERSSILAAATSDQEEKQQKKQNSSADNVSTATYLTSAAKTMDAKNEKQFNSDACDQESKTNDTISQMLAELPGGGSNSPPPAVAESSSSTLASASLSDVRFANNRPTTSTANNALPTFNSNAAAAATTTSIATTNQRLIFPDILHYVLSCTDEEITDAISWQPHGKSFFIKDPASFEKKAMPRFFGKGKYSSFIRKLNRWGFRQVVGKSSPDAGTFQHELFLRDQPDLVRNMSCKKAGSVRGINHAKRRQNALESLASLESRGPHSNVALAAIAAADTSALLPDYMLEASLRQRSQQLNLMGLSLANSLGLGVGIGGYSPEATPGLLPPNNASAASAASSPAAALQHPNNNAAAAALFAAAGGCAPPTSFGAAAYPYAGTYEQLLVKNQMLESALRAASAQQSPAQAAFPAIVNDNTNNNFATSQQVEQEAAASVAAAPAPTDAAAAPGTSFVRF